MLGLKIPPLGGLSDERSYVTAPQAHVQEAWGVQDGAFSSIVICCSCLPE